jgi:MFS family permease
LREKGETMAGHSVSDARSPERSWSIPFGGALALVVGNGPVSVFAFGVFMGSLEHEFGWSRASLSTGIALCALLSALSLPIVGLLMDKVGVRRVLMVAVCLFALNVAAISFSTSLAYFIALTALTGVTGAAQSPMGYVKSIAGHFDRRRGLAIGIAMSGIGIGIALVPQYVQWVIAEQGWRAGYVGLGLAILVVALPVIALLVREPRAAADPSVVATVPGLELREATRLRSFWCMAVPVLLVSIAVNGALVHVIPLLVDSGWTPVAATRVLAVAGIAGLVGRLLAGYLMDRVFAPFVASGFFALAILGLYWLGSGISPFVGMISIGLAAGAEVDMIGFFVSRYYGLRRFGQIYGVLFAVFTIGAGLGPLLMGASHTTFGSYYFGLVGCGAALAAAALSVLAVGPYRFGALESTGSSGTAEKDGARGLAR